MKSDQECALSQCYPNREKKSDQISRYVTKLMNSFKICNAEELSKTK